jgi:anti-sigma B factor antagonist
VIASIQERPSAVTISERTSGDVTILELHGRLTLGDGAEELREAVNATLGKGRNKLVLQLAGVPFVDSAGLGEIVRTVNHAKKAGGGARLASPTQRIVDLLRIAKVHSVVQASDSEEDAVRTLGGE